MSEERKLMIKQAFDTVAGGYDHPSLPWFPETARCMLQSLQLADGASLLDVCTGTGAVALRAAEQFSACRITGIDLSSGMLQQARTKAQVKNLVNVEFIEMDLDHLDFQGRTFDVVTCSFGLFFLPDMQAALRRMMAVLRPGGCMLISSFVDNAFEPFSDLFLARYQSFGREIPPLSWKRLSTPAAIDALFQSVGVSDVRYRQEALGHAICHEQQWWDVVWNAGYRGLLNQLDENERTQFEALHREEIARLCANGQAWLNTGVIIAEAVTD